ncbi:TM2 domain-containing 1 [Brachionus plicatilis]|uniref:TM2 domain-containing 1 n=1 Tax=Brachionus plicatilis TaxID=10195 RepID=A0A3M7QSU3_BRAPC|nr:TM2 domain-containing 1 [Brachionus plicatilis]
MGTIRNLPSSFFNKVTAYKFRMCNIPVIDSVKQNEINCTKNGLVEVECFPANNIICENKVFDGNTVGFYRHLQCRYVTSYNYQTTVLLSIFFGIFGIDRFYLGYYSIGLLKACTFGYMFIGYLVEMLLIITQYLEPADGSKYIIDYYGQILYPTNIYNNRTVNVSFV